MKKFKANSIDLKKMENIRGGDSKYTRDYDITITKKQQAIAKEDSSVEVWISGVLEV